MALDEKPSAQRFFCVDDGVPTTTIRLLQSACERRGVQWVHIKAQRFAYDDRWQLQPGDMLYRPAVSGAAFEVERFLYRPGVATFYLEPAGPFFSAGSPPLLFSRAGLPVPPTIPCATRDHSLIRAYVEHLGGLPIIVKVAGRSNGIGVMKVESLPLLFSLLDYLLAEGKMPLLQAHIAEATHWRVIALGSEVVAAYRNLPMPDDFRTYVSGDPADFFAETEPEMAQIAISAAQVIQRAFAGVDILATQDGQLFLLEANFPCYFAPPEEIAGIDVSGKMLDYLGHRAQELLASRDPRTPA
jgi:hypothetical protein